MKTPELKTGQMITIAYIIGIFIVMFVVYKFLGKIGLVTTAEKRKQEKNAEALRSVSEFNPLYLQDKTNTYKKLGTQAKDYAARLYKAIAGVGTNEDEIFNIFSQLKSKNNIAEISLYYRAGFNRDMLTDLMGDLNQKEQAKLKIIIDKLP